MFGVDNGNAGGGRMERKLSSGSVGGGVGLGSSRGARDRAGMSADDGPPTNILQASYVGAFDLVKRMVANGAAPDTPDRIQGSTPLHWASFGGHLDLVRWLVKTGGADVNRRNKDGCTPLLFACERGHTGVAQWLVREGGAQVNVKDDVMWQTPLHRVCLNSQRANNGSTISDDEDLILWLIEAGADFTAVDRFGNHVEELRSPTGTGLESRSKLCNMITAAREEEDTKEGARDKLKRRSSVRRKSTGDMFVQLSPKLEAKQRAPISRRGSRKTSHSNGGTRNGSGAGSVSSNNSNSSSCNGVAHHGGAVSRSPTTPSQGLNRASSYGSSTGTRSHARRATGGRVVSNSKAAEEDVFATPSRPARGTGGSGGGVAAPAAVAGARMGGGPPAPALAGEDELRGSAVGHMGSSGGAGYMGEMVAMFGGGKASGGEGFSGQPQYSRRSSERRDRERRLSSSFTADDERRHRKSMRAAEEALRLAGLQQSAVEETSEARRRHDGAGQQVVELIRAIAGEKSAGQISEEDFLLKKRQLLEMEQLRREAEDESRKRAEGLAIEDASAAILTSVGQNTPPPSPKGGGEEEDGSDQEDGPVPVAAPDAKDRRETYKASDIERYTSVESEGPRVFGEVPDSVKESLAAKDAAREAAAAKQQGTGVDISASSSGKEGKKGQEKDKNGGVPLPGNLDNGGSSSMGMQPEGARSGGRNKSSGGCVCVIM